MSAPREVRSVKSFTGAVSNLPTELSRYRGQRLTNSSLGGGDSRDETIMATLGSVSEKNSSGKPLIPDYTLNVNQMHECSQKLARILSACDNDRFDIISFCISCSLAAVRPLTVTELMDGLTIHFKRQGRSPVTCIRTTQDFITWLQQHEHPFMIDEHLRVTFEGKTMPIFLRTIPIRGIDSSHRTLALVCLQKVPRIREAISANASLGRTSALTSYASSFWEHHCENAAMDNGAGDDLSVDTIKAGQLWRHEVILGNNRIALVEDKYVRDAQEHIDGLELGDSWVYLKHE